MKPRRILIAAMWVNILTASATAETIVVRPDPCPFAADVPKIITLSGVEAIDLNPDRASADHILVLYPLQAPGWASARLLARFDLEGAPSRRRGGRGCR
ncbi:MAG: hypothetical protein A3E78_02995 [Alphaproteobacteria bacterium RIFCSPHIGHO2_12_FULL_63_12]|nr:MAG: hypothetical protein A3E78_02995 [Alphaproteobacteria bacterium RIFCSPHIGHO2_12_FULL_63_12]